MPLWTIITTLTRCWGMTALQKFNSHAHQLNKLSRSCINAGLTTMQLSSHGGFVGPSCLNHAFARQIGHSHPSLYRLLNNLRKDTALVHIALEAEARGQPPRKRVRRATRELQERLQNLCIARRDGSKSVAEALRGLGHTIRFVWVLKSTDVTWHRHKIRTFNVKHATCGAALSIMELMPDTLELHLCAHFFALLVVCIVKCCLCRISDE